MKAGAFVVLTMLLATPVAAKRPRCDPPEVIRLVAMVEADGGNIALILATLQRRMTAPQLECWAARTGDKAMLLALGRRYETGDGVPADSARAETLYTNAATPKPGTIFIYTPPIGNVPGRVMSISTGPDIAGLPEGDYRRGLMHVERRATKPDYRRGLKLIGRAAKAGFTPAIERLDTLGRIRT